MRTSTFLFGIIAITTQLLSAATGYGQGNAETVISLDVKNMPIQQVFQTIEEKADVAIMYENTGTLKRTRVTYTAENQSVGDILDALLAGKKLRWSIRDHVIRIVGLPTANRGGSMARAPDPYGLPVNESHLILVYPEVRGRVVDSVGTPLVGASVRVLNAEGKRTPLQTKTDGDGYFELKNVPEGYRLEISYIGHVGTNVMAATDVGTIELKAVLSELEEVEVMVNTGYQYLPKERATGSFEVIDNSQVSRDFATQNIIHRLEGVSPALVFDRRSSINSETPNERLKLRFRGPSTIRSDDQPLIVVDDFPFEGDIDDINPNDVENITLLKDGAAAAIWGAKAGNGVIVIQMKSGKGLHKTKIDVSLANKITAKPNLFESNRFIAAEDYIALEMEQYAKGQYRNLPTSILSPVVDLLFQRDAGALSEPELDQRLNWYRDQDFRRDVQKYLYRRGNDRNAFLSLSGGRGSHNYRASIGYDQSNSVLVGASTDRITLRMTNQFKLSDQLELLLGVDYSRGQQDDNAVSAFQTSGLVPNTKGMIYPYYAFRDANGNPIGIPRWVSPSYGREFYEETGRDWLFYPMQELELRNNSSTFSNYRLNTGLNLRPFRNVKISLMYNLASSKDQTTNNYDRNAAFAKNLINQFMSPTGAFVIPDGSIRHQSDNGSIKHAVRSQIDYSTTFVNQAMNIHALAGAEVSQLERTWDPTQILYDFNPDTYIGNNSLNFIDYFPVRPQSSMRIPQSGNRVSQNLDRFLSYYGLASVSWLNKYTLSTSLRWDASNLFGVKTNQKGVPLWSVGGTWSLHNEQFWRNATVNQLKIRATYGRSGNVNKNYSTYPTASFSTSSRTRLPETMIRSAGNPQLKWETVSTLNVGVDFGLFNNRLTGSAEYYTKDISDLLGDRVMDPTTGIKPGLGVQAVANYGTMRTRGMDFSLSAVILDRSVWKWNLYGNISQVTNKIMDYSTDVIGISDYFAHPSPANTGVSRDVLYAFPWFGLDPQTGSPLVMNGDQLGTTYGSYVTNYAYDDLVPVGNSIPTFSGALRSNVSAFNFTLDVMFLWKGKYYFRRESIDYSSLIQRGEMHSDFANRWRQEGDELHTSVPSMPNVLDSNRELYYNNSEALIERGDHIRLKHIQLSYDLKFRQTMPFRILLMAENLGVIWKKNGYGIDPDFHMHYYQPPRQFSIGVQATF